MVLVTNDVYAAHPTWSRRVASGWQLVHAPLTHRLAQPSLAQGGLRSVREDADGAEHLLAAAHPATRVSHHTHHAHFSRHTLLAPDGASYAAASEMNILHAVGGGC